MILLLKVEAAQEGNGDPKKDEARRQQNLDKPQNVFFPETGRRHCPLSQLVLVSSPGDRANQLLLLS